MVRVTDDELFKSIRRQTQMLYKRGKLSLIEKTKIFNALNESELRR